MPKKCYFRPGFTLVDLMILVTILGFIAAIAFPLYEFYILKARRIEGQETMLKIQDLQEKYLADYMTYKRVLADLGNFESENYTFALSNATSTTYIITATAKGRQVNDIGCIFMTLNQAGVKCPSADSRCPTHTDCWKQ